MGILCTRNKYLFCHLICHFVQHSAYFCLDVSRICDFKLLISATAVLSCSESSPVCSSRFLFSFSSFSHNLFSSCFLCSLSRSLTGPVERFGLSGRFRTISASLDEPDLGLWSPEFDFWKQVDLILNSLFFALRIIVTWLYKIFQKVIVILYRKIRYHGDPTVAYLIFAVR